LILKALIEGFETSKLRHDLWGDVEARALGDDRDGLRQET